MDANVVVAALIRPGGWTAQEFARTDVEWVAPEALLDELEEHAAEYAEKAGCPLEEWTDRISALMRRIRVAPARGTRTAASDLVRKAVKADPDDAIYVEVLVAESADLLWTRDTALLDALPGVAVMVVPREAPTGA